MVITRQQGAGKNNVSSAAGLKEMILTTSPAPFRTVAVYPLPVNSENSLSASAEGVCTGIIEEMPAVAAVIHYD
ncbi:hypothetical protein ABH991_002911 [Bradyrhizobium ottawaense]|uniref:Uncharacterized protein n=1 Tax=Bradyrhizobium ottawaense TaxID=931866 RepID=A0ABV4FK94_9BRAD|nr:hypothetical protein [Bradyrhizobium ottawaense]